jgi:hypothetical protein
MLTSLTVAFPHNYFIFLSIDIMDSMPTLQCLSLSGLISPALLEIRGFCASAEFTIPEIHLEGWATDYMQAFVHLYLNPKSSVFGSRPTEGGSRVKATKRSQTVHIWPARPPKKAGWPIEMKQWKNISVGIREAVDMEYNAQHVRPCPCDFSIHTHRA